jgi:integration host factor subunit alpha
MTLTKEHISASIQNRLGISKSESSYLVESVLETISRTLKSGENVLISGFGKFTVMEKGARRSRNPWTEQGFTLEPRRVVTFRCSTVLRDKINGKAGQALLMPVTPLPTTKS